MRLLIRWIIAALAILATAYVLPGVTVSSFFVAMVVAAMLGVVNAFIRPVLLLLTLPINILTLGLFTFVINALMVMLVANIVPGYKIASFWWALAFSLLLSLIMNVLDGVLERK
ncbi:MAG: phage holin family protein [Patescibacteria group bacterium]|jgi:putative membrane protein